MAGCVFSCQIILEFSCGYMNCLFLQISVRLFKVSRNTHTWSKGFSDETTS